MIINENINPLVQKALYSKIDALNRLRLGKDESFFISNENLEPSDNTNPVEQHLFRNCFAKGLSPKEFFLHSITGREGITDTAMKTATSGYIQRRMVKITEDVKIHNDGTVRNLNNNIIQFSYGNNFFNSSHSINKKNDILPFDINRLVTQINDSYETNL